MQIGLLIESLDRLDAVADWGYDYGEIVPGMLGPDADEPAAEEAARARLRGARVPTPTMCGFLPDPERLGLMLVGPNVNPERLRSYSTRIFDRMQRAGVEIMVLGSGTARTCPAGFPAARAHAQLREFVELCADLAEPRQLRVALEPQNYDDTNLLHTVPEALALEREVARAPVGVMADFFHMRLNEEPMDDLVLAGGELIHGHIAEPGRGRRPTTEADRGAFFAALRRAGYDLRVTHTGPLPAYPSNAEAAAGLKRLANGA
ncbi:MAG: sugar phosphate isomerase/epimerase [Chloroflexi bacterium]|nr:sugar phosphate isomerase/epimerase [Chloroflexota bacterium]